MRKTRSGPAPLPKATPHPALVEAARATFGAEGIESVAGRPHLATFSDDAGRWLLRLLPSDDPIEHVRARHAVLGSEPIRSLGIGPAPHPTHTAIESDRYLIETLSWLPGKSWAMNGRLMRDGHSLYRPLPPERGAMATLSATVARFHAASTDINPGVLPKLTIRDYQRRQRTRWQTVRDQLRESGAREVHIERWASASQRVIFAAYDVFEAAGYLDAPPSIVIHGNLWPAHVVTEGSSLGLIDWAEMAVAHPLIDVAQLIARFEGWGGAALEEVVESYLSDGRLTADDRRLLPVFGALDLAVETGHVLIEAYASGVDETSHYAELARSGAGQMLASLESIGWSIRQTNIDSKELRRQARDNARAARAPGQKPRPKRLTSKRPKQ
jgi:aminoglycoside phosphotransferase (APT) family kinase protein